MACEDAHQSERVAAATLIESALAQQVWIADRHFCTAALLRGLSERQACFIVREHAHHPRVSERGPWGQMHRHRDRARARARHQAQRATKARNSPGGVSRSNCHRPQSRGYAHCFVEQSPIGRRAATIARLYRKRWRIEGMFQRLESVLHSEIKAWAIPARRCWGLPQRCSPTTYWPCSSG